MIDRFKLKDVEYVAVPAADASCAGCALSRKPCGSAPECWEPNKDESKFYVFQKVPQEQS